ncbi:hypothetical protein B0T10DRAFT_526373 [Thelonectria olida]|uniref:BZIP domain-containing protein n=1 Tax=Thelonectria olida TaxID=1576542 RepID=A0A9P8WDV3_9HYPO|nr:hypothetical protein B0T10DRAFT_526373 [Thelonectria olida]
MSQGGPASHHASRRSSRSPVDDDQLSPSSTRYGKSGSGEVRQELAGVPYTNGDSRTQIVPPRTLGVHNILNPSEPRRLASGVVINPPPTGRPSEIEVPTSAPGSFAAGRHFAPTLPASMSLPGTPVGALTPLGGPGSERNSPTTTFPFPAINPRKKASPKPPRAMSLSHGQASHNLDPRQHPPLPSMVPTKRPYESEIPEEHRSQLPGLHHPMGVPPSPAGGGPHSSRSLSQPMIQSPGTPWSEMIRRHGLGGGGMGAGEPQQAYMTLPGSDTPIPVQVDYSQASKKADEKRQRNAVASTRHRRKKKIMLEENTKQLQDLRDERRQMEVRIDELTQQRDWYREERNRLRDIVSQTPGISGLAVRQPSPNSARSSSFAERSPMVTGPQTHMPSPQGGFSEVASGERPTQRRRTDDRPEFSMPVYGTPTGVHPGMSPGALPPMQAPAYGVPSRPTSAASSTGGERIPLPPLRAMEGPPPPGVGPGQVHEQDPRTGQWVTVQPRAPDAGWATRRPEGPR